MLGGGSMLDCRCFTAQGPSVIIKLGRGELVRKNEAPQNSTINDGWVNIKDVMCKKYINNYYLSINCFRGYQDLPDRLTNIINYFDSVDVN